MKSRGWNKKVLGILVISFSLMLAGHVSLPTASAGIQNIEQSLWQDLVREGSSNLVVEFVEQADLTPAYSMTWEERGTFVYEALQDTARKSQAEAMALLDKQGINYRSFIAGNELYVFGSDINAAMDLASMPKVRRVRAPITIPLDPIIETEPPAVQGTTTWGIQDTGADDFWTTYGQGAGIVVAGIDTGVQWDHPGLMDQFKCKSTPTSSNCWLDPSSICAGAEPCDNDGHGTHTMGTMVAADNPILAYMAGMAPDATWIACKGCEYNSCSDFALNSCADWLLAPGGNPANRPHVVNNSWGGGGGNTWYLAKVNAWRAAGIFPAFSAGNNYDCTSLGSPGDYQESLATAAHMVDRTIADFSSKGPSAFGHAPYTKPNISAPGHNICSTIPGNTYQCGWQGTSMASPHTAGAVALLWSCNPSLIGNMTNTFEALQSTADAPAGGSCGAPPDAEGNYTYGYGYLNVYAAGQQYCSGAQTAPVPDVKVAGQDGPVIVSPSQPVELTLDVQANDYLGETVDFFLILYSPSYGLFPLLVVQPPLPDINDASLGSIAFPLSPTGPGIWIFMIILDDTPNGAVDGTSWDDKVIIVSTGG